MGKYGWGGSPPSGSRLYVSDMFSRWWLYNPVRFQALCANNNNNNELWREVGQALFKSGRGTACLNGNCQPSRLLLVCCNHFSISCRRQEGRERKKTQKGKKFEEKNWQDDLLTSTIVPQTTHAIMLFDNFGSVNASSWQSAALLTRPRHGTQWEAMPTERSSWVLIDWESQGAPSSTTTAHEYPLYIHPSWLYLVASNGSSLMVDFHLYLVEDPFVEKWRAF